MILQKFSQDKNNQLLMMSSYVNHLRALYIIYQDNHWKISGDSFYGNHLLFERLYNNIQEMVDEAAEKCIGIFGELKTGDISSIAKKYFNTNDNSSNKLISISINAEKDFQKLAKETYDSLKESGLLTLGLDDMIMSHASKSEVHLYLLQQAM